MAILKADPYIGKRLGGVTILGYVLDVKKGTAEEIKLD